MSNPASPAHGGFDGRPDVKKLQIEEDARALVLQLHGEREAAARQHAKADLVKPDLGPERCGELLPGERIRNAWRIEGDDEAMIGHGLAPCPAVMRCGGGSVKGAASVHGGAFFRISVFFEGRAEGKAVDRHQPLHCG